MPTYAYACTECGHRFDAVQAFSDNALTDCPECTGKLRKLFSPVGIVFKGSGFYRTDSRKSANASDKPSTKTEKKETAGSASSGPGGSGGSTSNPASSTSGTTTATKAAS